MTAIGEARDAGRLTDHAALVLLGAMRPRTEIAERIDIAGRRFREAGGRIVCQMRVERDWQTYMEARLAPRLSATQDLTTDPIAIVAKLAATFGTDIGPVLVTCDMRGLSVSPMAVADAVLRETGVRLFFKQDMLDGEPPTSPLAASLIDFELMATADHIVGTTLSSFFGLAALTHLARTGRSTEAWAYNAPGAALVKRSDDGAFANLARATA